MAPKKVQLWHHVTGNFFRAFLVGISLSIAGLQMVNADSLPRQPGIAAMGLGLAGIADWSTQQPFIDVMKTARPWIGHQPGQWGGMTTAELADAGLLDPDGWPVEIPDNLRAIGTVVLTDLPPKARSLAGRYRISFDGDGIIEPGGRADNIRYATGQVEFDFTPGPGPVTLDIRRTDRSNSGDYLRNIRIVKLDNLAAHARGEIFNPVWLNRIEGFGVLRFMDWMDTNGSELADWADRPEPGDYTYAAKGVPVEVLVALANTIAANPWFNMPHRASDGFITEFAGFVHRHLNPALTAYVEYSNEVWNWQFQQAVWAEEQAASRWGVENGWMQYYGLRTAQTARIWKGVYGESAEDRLVMVLATQTGWQGLEQDALNAPLWVGEDAANHAPATDVDAYAIAGYFGRVLGTPERAPLVRQWLAQSRAAAETAAGGLTGTARDAAIMAHRYDTAIALAAQELRDGSVSGDRADTLADLAGNTFPYHAQVASEYGLDLIMYEGGTHVTGIAEILDDNALTSFFTVLNYAPEMGALYTELLGIWQASGGQLFNVYADIVTPGKWGSWGGLRHLDDANPRWDALLAFP